MTLYLYNHVIKFHNIRAYMSEISSIFWHSNNNMPWKVFNVHVNVSIDTKLCTCKIYTYDIKQFFRNVPYCARLAYISSPLIAFPLIDFYQKLESRSNVTGYETVWVMSEKKHIFLPERYWRIGGTKLGWKIWRKL